MPEDPAAPAPTDTATTPGAEFAALDEEQRVLEEAAARPAVLAQRATARRDRALLLAALALILFLVGGWVGGTAVIELRRDVAALEDRVHTAEDALARAETSRARAAVARARTDLREVEASLPQELAARVRLAVKNLGYVEDQLDTAR